LYLLAESPSTGFTAGGTVRVHVAECAYYAAMSRQLVP
jgi:hypothetical protein